MIVTHKGSMNLESMDPILQIEAVQNDSCTRQLELSLYAGEEPWPVPEDASIQLQYCKADGTGGLYDTLPDGSPACLGEDNRVTVTLAPQVCTVPGVVRCNLILQRQGQQLSSFPIRVLVQPNCQAPEMESEDYFMVTGWMPVPESAQVGAYIRVAAVNDRGIVTATDTVAPETVEQQPLPILDLAALGLPDIPTDGTLVVAENLNLAEAVRNLSQGPAKLVFRLVSGGTGSTIAHAVTGADSCHCSFAWWGLEQPVSIYIRFLPELGRVEAMATSGGTGTAGMEYAEEVAF